MKRTLFTAALLTLVSACFAAPQRSSFLPQTTMTGVEIIRNSNLSFTVALSGNARVNGQRITEIGGFYLLDSDNDLRATGSQQGNFKFAANYKGQGGVVGFEAPDHRGLQPGQQRLFTFSTVTGGAEALGVKLNLENCKTIFVSTCDTQAVPEPATMAALGIGALGMIRRRRQIKK